MIKIIPVKNLVQSFQIYKNLKLRAMNPDPVKAAKSVYFFTSLL